jgi:hypothetical protein
MLKSHENSVGAWAFLIGIILALVIGIFTTLLPIPALIKYSAQIYGVLALLGVVIGFMIVRGRDSQTFLISGGIIVVVSKFGIDGISGSLIGIGLYDIVSSIFSAFLVLFVPATIIVALKTVFAIAKV